MDAIWSMANEENFDEDELYERLKKDGEYYKKRDEIRARLCKYPFLRASKGSIEELLRSASYHVSVGDATQFEKEIIPIINTHLEIYRETE